jgi:hypothetical protein
VLWAEEAASHPRTIRPLANENIHYTRHNFHRLNLVIALVFLPGVFFAGEGQEPQAVPTDANPAGYDLQIVDGQLIRPGGKLEATLANVVNALRDQYTEANIIFSPSTKER